VPPVASERVECCRKTHPTKWHMTAVSTLPTQDEEEEEEEEDVEEEGE
jgi:hypothetical protein